jgi:type 1 glutamine amidotransferase
MASTVMAKMAADNNFTVDFTTDTSLINDANLAKYQVFFQMELAPFEMSPGAQKAFEKFIGQKKGWVGIHAAGLVRPDWFPQGEPYWQWYEDFFGGVRYVIHPALQNGTLKFEDRAHPATKNMPASAQFKDEWYEFSASPRPNVHVLATADEKSYTQVTPMGDHPLVWTNQKFPRMIYIGVGHDVSDWSNSTYLALVHDAVMWASTSDSAAASVLPEANRRAKPPQARGEESSLAGLPSLRCDAAGRMLTFAGAPDAGTRATVPSFPLPAAAKTPKP